jgi:hypothetical protein
LLFLGFGIWFFAFESISGWLEGAAVLIVEGVVKKKDFTTGEMELSQSTAEPAKRLGP